MRDAHINLAVIQLGQIIFVPIHTSSFYKHLVLSMNKFQPRKEVSKFLIVSIIFIPNISLFMFSVGLCYGIGAKTPACLRLFLTGPLSAEYQ